ncbi:glycine cleavage H-protein [Caldicellulosiruptor saccharolyticus DSM 8903]|uniref:Glycine cleavage H-protein n=1 Tax=Caldicellulosiruptor saccharolyticus (strain ATCC 43494 / DSM 8903 / Tp8T 6331) TaxID=351627 RepID=A4XIC6_CALS8|nr:glycine cleavage system protein H [Caldicellulosiruptor saccharolyticus]ABP66661.1 glycine cleavage H-protein [Caldicellulosiruptor saccharolyticus DSM 8903]
MLYNERLLYGDLWVELNGSLASVGITKNLERELGDIVIFEFLKTNGYIQQGEEFARIETIYKTYTLKSPVSGFIRSVNSKLCLDPTLLNLFPEETEIISIDIQLLV